MPSFQEASMNQKGSSWRIGAATLVFAAASVVGGSVAAKAAPQTAASTLIDGTTDTVTNIDPAGNYNYGTDTVDREIFEHLLGFQPQSTVPSPELATGCAPNETELEWTCALRQGVKFSNGDPFTSADVAYSFDRVVKIHDPSRVWTLLANLQSVTTNGPESLTFHLKHPQSTWEYILTTIAGYIVDHNVYPADKILPNSSTQISTGPYRLVKYTPAQNAVFSAWDGDGGPKPKMPNLVIAYFSKSSTMKLALQRGELDMAFRTFTPAEYASLETTKGIKVWKGPGIETRYLVFDMMRGPTDKLAVRQALACLMPRETLAKRIYHGLVEPLYSIAPAGMPGHTDTFMALYGRSPDPAKAKAVLERANLKTPVPLTIWWTPTHYGDASAEEYTDLQCALDASGLFAVTLRSAEWGIYSETLGIQYNAFQLGWFPDYPDAEDYLVPFYGTKSDFLSNGYSNLKMDEFLAREQGAQTWAERLRFIQHAQLLAAQEVPIIPYWQGDMIAVSRDNVQGIPSTLGPSFVMRFWLLSKR
jgi:peptide/nickel transport system substrate-binding protein